MTMLSYLPAHSARPGRARIGDWMAKRGVLLVFLQMPAAAVVVGYALQLVSLSVASFAVFVCAAAFPAWVSYRTGVSQDPDEPVHDLHRHALRALVVVSTFTMALTSALFVAGASFWHLWYDLGAELTAEPSRGAWSLLAGVVVYGVTALGLVISYFVLIPRDHPVNETGPGGVRLSA